MTPERFQKITSVLSKRQNDITVVLENVFDPHNIAAVMRTCDAVGIQDIYVLNTKMPMRRRWGYRSSSSANKWITVHQFEEVQPCFEALRSAYDVVLTTHLSHDAVHLYNLDLTQKMALVFGNEHFGVSEEIRALADGKFFIPQVGIIRSLNISVACAVTLYEAYRQKNLKGHYGNQKLGTEQYNELSKQWGISNE
ncbi:MAG TPA: RNA methyltransferase, partial [Chitinophagaceae bacterium]|nr:RNA methyltransferase [Chitinophagaceae bacterium]